MGTNTMFMNICLLSIIQIYNYILKYITQSFISSNLLINYPIYYTII